MKKRILIFNVNWIGDVIFSTAAIRALRRNFPDSYIACVIPPRCREILEGNPYLDEIIIFDEKGRHRGLLAKLDFCRRLKRMRFDTVYLLHRSMSRALITFLAGIPERIGYATPKRSFLLTRKFTPPDIFRVHRAEYYLDLLRQCGLEVKDTHSDFFFLEQHRQAAARLLEGFCREGDFVVGINAGGNWMPKRWPPDNFAALAAKLYDEFKAKVVITGGPQDDALARGIESKSGVEVLSVCGRCGLKEFGALSGMFDVFITADSGPLHIAAASGAKHIIALFGPTDPALTGPLQDKNTVIVRKDVGCRIPCYAVDCADNRCMKAIAVSDVIEQVRKIYYARNK